MMTASLHGRLTSVKEVQTRTGTPMTVGSLVLNLPIAKSDETEALWVNLVAFNDIAEELALVPLKTNISVMGRMQYSRYEKDGETVTTMQIICDGILTVRSARPRGGRRAKKSTPRATQRGKPEKGASSAHNGQDWQSADKFQRPGDPFGDKIPF